MTATKPILTPKQYIRLKATKLVVRIMYKRFGKTAADVIKEAERLARWIEEGTGG